MTSEAAPLPPCPRCGNPYRLPAWGRCYACAACGAALQARAVKMRLRLPKPAPLWLLTCGVVVLAGGLLARALAERRAPDPSGLVPQLTQPSTGAAGPASSEAVSLAADLRDRVYQRIGPLSEDLAKAPRHPALLAALAENYLMLVALERSGRRPLRAGDDERAFNTGVEYVRRLAAIEPLTASSLERRYRARAFSWMSEGQGGEAASLWALHAGARDLFRNPSVQAFDRSIYLPLSNRLLDGMAETNSRLRPQRGAEFPAAEGRNLLPDPGDLPSQGELSLAPPPLPLSEPGAAFPALRKRVAEHPGDGAAADRLGRLLEQGAERLNPPSRLPGGGPEAAASWWNEAAGVYSAAASAAALRVDRAAFYAQSGADYGRRGDEELRYQELRSAVAEAPWSAGLWWELAEAALRTGRVDEAQHGVEKAVGWNLPEIE